MPGLKLFVLGAPRIEQDSRPVELERRKAFALLVYLAVTGELHRRDTLATLFWPDFDQTRARAALRRTLASLKKALHPNPLQAQRETIALLKEAGSGFWTDVGRFRSLLAACRIHHHGQFEYCASCPARITEAVALYRGPFLAGFTLRDSPDFDEWQLLQAEILQQELARALERLVHAHIGRKEFERAIIYNRQWILLDSLNEPANRSLMSLFAWTGQRQAAFRQYAQLCRLLELELGLPPQPETVELYQALRDATRLPPDEQSKSPLGVEEKPARSLVSHPSLQTKTLTLEPASALFERIVRGHLVGRERELAQMVGLWERAVLGEGQTLLLSGEAGIGKTRLARELATLAEAAGAIVLIGRCQATGDSPYAPVAQLIQAALDNQQTKMCDLPQYIMADLLALAPHLRPRYPKVGPNPRLHPSNERQRMFESFASWCKLLATVTPVLLWVEDLHWADNDTLALFHHLVHQVQHLRLLLLMTYRDTELALTEHGYLQETVLSLNRARLAAFISLGPLSQEQTRQQMAALLATDEEISDEFLASIYRECEGNPFFVEEVCKALVEEGKLFRVGDQWRRLNIEQIVIPRSVREAILSRVTLLPQKIQETLQLAAVIGREFDVQLLWTAGQWEREELVEILDYGKRAHLLEEATTTGVSRFVFTHALIPFALREHLGALRLQHLHQRVAAAIESHYPDQLDSLAYHYAAAGESEKATIYSLRAAEFAEKAYAYDSTIWHLRTALRFISEAGTARRRLEILERLADVHRLNGDHVQALQLYQEALALTALVAEMDTLWQVRLRRKLSEEVFGTEWIEDVKPFAIAARVAIEEGMRLLADQPLQQETVRLLICRSQAAWRDRTPQDWEAAERHAGAAVTAAEALGQPVELCAALDALAVVAAARGRFRERVEIAKRRVKLSHKPGFADELRRVHLLNETGVALSDVGQYAEAIDYLEEAEYLATRIRAVEEVLYSLRAQALCAYRLDRWDGVPMEEKFQKLRHIFQDEQLSPMCFHLALQAAVLALQGQLERARAVRDESLALMIRGEVPERWGRPAHY